MLDLLLTSLLTSLLTLLGAWFFLYQPPKYAVPPSQALPTGESDDAGAECAADLDESDEEWFLKESGHELPSREVNASVAEIDAIRRSFIRDKPPHLEANRGRGKASAAPRPPGRTSRIHCRSCDKDFVDEVALKQHQVFEHSGNGSLSGGLPSKTPSESSGSSNLLKLACDLCRKEYKSPHLLRQHKADDHPWSIYCNKCRVKFSSTNQATQHYESSSAHMPRPKKGSRKPVESGNYVPFEGFNPDPNIPEVQQTYGCGECKERFNSAKERDEHMKDLFAHPDPIALASAFPPLSSAYPASPKASSVPPTLEEGLGLGVEISSRFGIALDRMHLPFDQVARRPSNVIDFEDDEIEQVVEREIVMEVDQPLVDAPITEAGIAVSFDEPDEERLAEPETSDTSSVRPDQSVSAGESSPRDPLPPSPRKPGSAALLSPALSDGSVRPWYSPKPLSPTQIHPDAGIVWGVPWSPPVPGPESYPPLNGRLATAPAAIWGPLTSPRLTSPRTSESTVEETPPPETPPAVSVPSPKTGITPGRWSIGEKPAFPMPDLTPRIKQKLTYDSVEPLPPTPPAPAPKPDDITAPYIHPTRLSQPLWADAEPEPLDTDEDWSVAISGANSIPVSNRRSAGNHYRLAGDHPSITIPLPSHIHSPRRALPPTENRIEPQVPLFRHPKQGTSFAGYAPPGPTPAPPRAAAIAAWSKPPKAPVPSPSYEPTVHSSWLPTPISSPSGDTPQREAHGRNGKAPPNKFHNTLEPTFDADEWFTEPTPKKKPVVKMQARKESPAPRLSFAQRTAAAAATKQPSGSQANGRSRAGPVGSSGWAAQQTAVAAPGGDDDYGGW